VVLIAPLERVTAQAGAERTIVLIPKTAPTVAATQKSRGSHHDGVAAAGTTVATAAVLFWGEPSAHPASSGSLGPHFR